MIRTDRTARPRRTARPAQAQAFDILAATEYLINRVNAARKISRTSDSMDRPCSAARTRSAALRSSSKSRIVNVAIATPFG